MGDIIEVTGGTPVSGTSKINRGRRRAVMAGTAAAITLSSVAVLGSATPAQAWAWDGHVQVIGSEHTCGISANSGWAWYQADDGESGWATKGNSGSIVFDLQRVPGYGASTLVRISWGVSNCSRTAYRVISRPSYGSQTSVGVLG